MAGHYTSQSIPCLTAALLYSKIHPKHGMCRRHCFSDPVCTQARGGRAPQGIQHDWLQVWQHDWRRGARAAVYHDGPPSGQDQGNTELSSPSASIVAPFGIRFLPAKRSCALRHVFSVDRMSWRTSSGKLMRTAMGPTLMRNSPGCIRGVKMTSQVCSGSMDNGIPRVELCRMCRIVIFPLHGANKGFVFIDSQGKSLGSCTTLLFSWWTSTIRWWQWSLRCSWCT